MIPPEGPSRFRKNKILNFSLKNKVHSVSYDNVSIRRKNKRIDFSNWPDIWRAVYPAKCDVPVDQWLDFTNNHDSDFGILDIQCPCWSIIHSKAQGELKSQILTKSQKYFQATGQLPTVSYMLAFSLKLIIQIVFQTIFLFMILWMTLFHKRWENFRYFMIRNYSAESVNYLSGFLILFAFTITTLGEGFLSLRIRLE